MGDPDRVAITLSPGCSILGLRLWLLSDRKSSRRKEKQANSIVAHMATRRSKPRKRVVTVMKEGYFETMPWKHTFVDGPMDPKWNKHNIYCQICKCNVSNCVQRSQRDLAIFRHIFAKTRKGDIKA